MKKEMSFVYEKDGKQATFKMDNLPDSTWKYVRTDTKVIRAATIKDFSFVDPRTEMEIGDELLADTGNVFIATIPNLAAADAGCSDGLNDIYDYARDHRMRFLCATATTGKDVSRWIDRTGRRLSLRGEFRGDVGSLGALQSRFSVDSRRKNCGEMEQQQPFPTKKN